MHLTFDILFENCLIRNYETRMVVGNDRLGGCHDGFSLVSRFRPRFSYDDLSVSWKKIKVRMRGKTCLVVTAIFLQENFLYVRICDA